MVIKATSAPLEVLFAIQAFDFNDVLVSNLVELDTVRLVVKQLVITTTCKPQFNEIPISSYQFLATTPQQEKLLREFLPSELWDHLVVVYNQ